MDTYEIKIMPRARRNIASVHLYITNTLMNPMAADNTVAKIFGVIDKLSLAPIRGRIIGSINGNTVRIAKANNYAIIYIVLDDKLEVDIVSVEYARRNLTERYS